MEQFFKLICNAYVSTALFFSNLLSIMIAILFDKQFDLPFYASIFFAIWFGVDAYKYWIKKSIDFYLKPIIKED